MALFDSGTPVANVALSDTFNTWRIRTNQINTQAAGLASNNTFTGALNTFSNAVAVNGPVTAPVVTANSLAGTSLSAASASIEELEETAKLHLLLQGLKTRTLTDLQVRDVEETFSS